jgi:hypothetical protein
VNTSKWAFRAFLCIGMLQTVSCTKNVDTVTNDSVTAETSSNLTFPATNEFSNCKLRYIYQSYGEGGGTTKGLFSYNSAGNPVSVLNDYDVADDYYFYYDRQGRLKGFLSTGDFGSTMHYYGYDANNRIVKDTSVRNPDGIEEQIFVSTLTYDTQGRIIKENIKHIYNGPGYDGVPDPLQPDRNPTYTYDSRGNLGVWGWKSSSYDYKVSIFRAHPIFQFIHRNYSRNNSSVQAKYNSRGLPLTVIPGNDWFFNLKNVTRAIYDCQ